MKNEANINDKARAAYEKKAALGADIDFAAFADKAAERSYLSDPAKLSPEQQKQLENIGMEVAGEERAGTYMQVDHSVVHCNVATDGVEILSTDDALKKYDWLSDYWWQAVEPDADKYTARAALHQEHGYFIHVSAGKKLIIRYRPVYTLGRKTLSRMSIILLLLRKGRNYTLLQVVPPTLR